MAPTAKVVTVTLRDLGYDVDLETDGPLAQSDCWFGALSPDADVSFTAWAIDYPSAAAFLAPLLTCFEPYGTPTLEGVGDVFPFNAANFCDPKVDQRMQRALDLQLTDPHASTRAFEALEHDLVNRAALISYQTGIDTWLVSKRLSNVEFSPQLYGLIVSQVWIS
jgi:ABC-type oligopeptide transport system substrate-binding subunit